MKDENDEKKPFLREHLKKEVAGIFWLAAGVFFLLCLVSFDNADPSFNNNFHPETIGNFGGQIGAYLADLLLQAFGLPALLIPPACILTSWRLLRFRDIKVRPYKAGAFTVLLFSLDGLIALQLKEVSILGRTIGQAGGAVGDILGNRLLAPYLNKTGAALFLFAFFIVSAILASRFSMVLFLEGVLDRLGGRIEQRRQRHVVEKVQVAREKGERLEAGPIILPPLPKLLPVPTKTEKKKEKEALAPAQVFFDFLESTGTYHKPPLNLLDHEGEAARPVDKEALMMNARLLEKKLKDFGVEGEVTEVKPGPVVTMYEFAPGARRQGEQDRRPLRRPLHGAAGALHPHRRPDPRQRRGRHRDPQPGARNGLAQGDLRLRRVPEDGETAAAGPRQGHLRPHRGHRPGPHAAPAGRRRHRHRQVGLHQHHDPLPPLPRHPAATCASSWSTRRCSNCRSTRGSPISCCRWSPIRRRRRWPSTGRCARWSGATG